MTRDPAPLVLGVDGAKGGWVGALLPVTGRGAVRWVDARDIGTLVGRATDAAAAGGTGGVGVVAVDIPIGLPDTGRRRADGLARARLGARRSSVFPTPVRDAVLAPTYADARRVSVERTGGVSLSAQAYGLRRAILDVDAYARSGPSVRVVEVHPEMSFAAMRGAPMGSSKRTAAGRCERVEALRDQGITVADLVEARGADDLLDAAAAAWSGARVARGEAESLPDPPERFGDGLEAAIHV